MRVPKPKTVGVVCDVCGLDWKLHKPDAKGKVGLDECVRLLRAELAKRPYANYLATGSAAGLAARGVWVN